MCIWNPFRQSKELHQNFPADGWLYIEMRGGVPLGSASLPERRSDPCSAVDHKCLSSEQGLQ